MILMEDYMKKVKFMFGTLLLAFVSGLTWVGVANAQHFATSTETDQIIHSSVYSADKEVTIKGTIYGDVFCAGQKVTVDATVYGDVICAGMDVTISGKVEGNVRAAGQFVALHAAVSKSATVTAMNFTLDPTASVGQDLTASGDQLKLNGTIQRDAVLGATQIMLNSHVGRNVKADSPNVELKEDARIAGGFHYTSERNATISQNAEVKGEIKHVIPEAPKEEKSNGGFDVFMYILALFSLTMLGLILSALFPRFMQKTSSEIMASAPKIILTGFIGGLLIIVLFVGLLVSLIGIPLAFILFLAGLVSAILSGPVVAFWIGRLIFRNKQNINPVLIALVGGPILITLCYLPWIGWLFQLVAYWFGLGALLLSLKPYIGDKLVAAKTKR